jgi:hypothetical protein
MGDFYGSTNAEEIEPDVLVLARVPDAVPEEVDGATLPDAAQDLRDCRLEPGVGIGDGELGAAHAALDETSEEVGPERFVLGLADVDREDLPTACLMDPMEIPGSSARPISCSKPVSAKGCEPRSRGRPAAERGGSPPSLVV